MTNEKPLLPFDHDKTALDLYGESLIVPPKNTSNSDQPIEIDFSKNWTLLELIKLVKDNLPVDETIPKTIYFVCGKKCGDSDYNSFFIYLETIQNPLTFVFRGYIHPDFVRLLNLQVSDSILISKDSRLIYNPKKLHLLLQNLKGTKPFQMFLSVLQDIYLLENYKFYIDLTEMESLGFQFEKF